MKVSVQGVRKYYGSVHAVDGISLETYPSRIFGLLGPNGAGKTTIIRMIMNIIRPDAGSVLFDGREIKAGDKNRIGYLPEERGLYKKTVVNDLLLYFASLKGKTRGEAQKNIDAWLQRFQLSDWKKRKVDELSKGLITYPRWVEAELAEGVSTDQLLQALVGRVSIKRFELMSPSLHKIFLNTVGKKGFRDE